MGEIKIRRLDDWIIAALKFRAMRNGISLEEEVRQILRASAGADRDEFVQNLRALHRKMGDRPGRPELDSVRLIREERDRTG